MVDMVGVVMEGALMVMVLMVVMEVVMVVMAGVGGGTGECMGDVARYAGERLGTMGIFLFMDNKGGICVAVGPFIIVTHLKKKLVYAS